MLLTEHQEQYENRNDTSKSSKRPSEDELKMIRDSILLPHMVTMVQKSLTDIENSSNLLKKLYLAVGQEVLDAMSKDLYNLRRELAKRSIKVINDEQIDLVIYHRFVCRGYEERFGMVREVMRSEISLQLAKYVKEIVGRLA
nr:hypothetical protein [Paenibacillus turpanensis]